MTTARDPQKKKRAPSKGRVLLWAGVFLLNFVLLTAAVSLAVFPQAGPLTAERLARLPYFEGCELLDVHTRAGGSARLFGQSDADWVLYRNSAGETRLVGVSWSLYTSRFRIDEKTDAAVPGDRLYHTAQVQSGSGLYEVSVQTQDRIMDARCIAGMQAPQSSRPAVYSAPPQRRVGVRKHRFWAGRFDAQRQKAGHDFGLQVCRTRPCAKIFVSGRWLPASTRLSRA